MRQQAIITRIGSLAAEEQHGFPKDATELSADSSYIRRSHPSASSAALPVRRP